MKHFGSKRRYARVPVAFALGAICFGTAGLAAAQSSNNIYGNFRYSFNYVDQAGQAEIAAFDDNIRTASNASRLGFRGEMQSGMLAAFYHLEGGVDVDNPAFTGRFYYAGVRSDFGSVTIGRHSTAYKMGGLAVDPFYDTAAPGPRGFFGEAGHAGATYGLSTLTNGWASNALAYTSPVIGPGLTLNGAVYADDSEEDDHSFAAGIAWGDGPFSLGFQYFDGDGGNTWAQALSVDRAYRGHGSFTAGPIKFGISYERVEDLADGEDVDFAYGAATYNLTSETRLSASVGWVEGTNLNIGANKGIGFNVGAFHNILPNATLYAFYSKVDFDANIEDTDIVSIGFVYNFDASL